VLPSLYLAFGKSRKDKQAAADESPAAEAPATAG
jgi:hypothetical protein